jgi:mutual gliding-motility protein MglA
MAFLNAATRQLHVNVAYFGPALSGKTTNLQVIYESTNPEARSDWGFALEPFPVVTFYFTPLSLTEIDGNKLVFHLSTIPGQVFYDAGRKHLLRAVDGVVFVADSQVERFEANLEMLENLQSHLAEHERTDVPLVFQHNKCDLPTAVSSEELDGALNPGGHPYVRAVATQRIGVFDTLKTIAKLVILGLRDGRVKQADFVFLKAPTEALRLWNAFRLDVVRPDAKR